jgi:hypothetical protein
LPHGDTATALQNEYDALRQAQVWLDDTLSLLYFDNDRLRNIFPKGRDHIRYMVQTVTPTEALQSAPYPLRTFEPLPESHS